MGKQKEDKAQSFKVGDRVKWASQAGGSWKEKEGVVVYVRPEKEPTRKDEEALEAILCRGRAVFDWLGAVFDRIDGGVVVEIKLSERSSPRFYCPRTGGLDKVGG